MDQYAKHLRWAEVRVGILITVGLAVLFFGVMFAGNIASLFQHRITIYAIFSDARGLQVDAPVWLSGIEVGSVSSLRLKGPGAVEAIIRIDEDKFAFLRTDSVAVISTMGLFGDKFVELRPGTPEAGALAPGATIKGMTGRGLEDISKSVEDNMSRLAELTARVNAFVVLLEQGQGSIPKLLRDPALYDSLSLTASRLKRITENLEKGKGTLGQLLNEDTLYRSMTDLVQEMERYTRMIKDSQGTLNKLITDPTLYDRMTQTTERLDEILARLEKGQGALGNMLQNDDVWIELRTTIREFNALLQDVQKNPKKYFKFSIF